MPRKRLFEFCSRYASYTWLGLLGTQAKRTLHLKVSYQKRGKKLFEFVDVHKTSKDATALAVLPPFCCRKVKEVQVCEIPEHQLKYPVINS